MKKANLEKVIDEYISINNKEKMKKIGRKMKKLDKGNNNFVQTRDAIVLAAFLLKNAHDFVVKDGSLRPNQRERLLEQLGLLIDDIGDGGEE